MRAPQNRLHVATKVTMKTHSLWGKLILSLAALAIAFPAAAAPKKLLVFTQSKGFVHNPVKRGTNEFCLSEQTVTEIGKTSGVFEAVCSQDASTALTAENLKQFDGVLFYTTGDLLKKEEDRDALINFIKSGKAFIGTHSAADTYPNYKPYIEMLNGNFNGHPWGAGTMCTFTNHEPTHPIMAMYPAEFQFRDEIYQYKFYEPGAVRVLMSLNMEKNKPQMPWHVPVAWVRDYGSGRVFFTNLGHNDATWKDERFRSHLLAGIRWALKLDDGPAKPNPEMQALEYAKSFLVTTSPQDATALVAKVSAKAGDAAFMSKLVSSMADYNKLPSPDAKKAKPEEVEAANAKKAEALKKVLASIQ
jgi:uncharacterized protein